MSGINSQKAQENNLAFPHHIKKNEMVWTCNRPLEPIKDNSPRYGIGGRKRNRQRGIWIDNNEYQTMAANGHAAIPNLNSRSPLQLPVHWLTNRNPRDR